METTQAPGKTLRNIRIMVTMASILAGIVAGGDIFRYFIEVPAWRHLDINDWVQYSRHADLGNGIILFPLEAFSVAVLLIIPGILLMRDKTIHTRARLPIFLAAVFAVAGLLLTFMAAPFMLGLRSAGNEPQVLQYTFDQFHFWGAWRAVVQVLSFFCCIWAMNRFVSR